jgi:tetratricopeptide (TPR) repeat protein
VRRAALVLFVLLATPVPASGQQESILGEAMRLATEGQGDSARAFTQGYLQRLSPNDSLYPEALYTAGVVAGSTADQQMYLRRVSIEFSQSSGADDALLRLAQIAFAEQDFAGALRAAERVVLDYPFSNVFAEANYWAGRSGLELGNVAEACSRLEQAQETAGENVELTNRVRFYRLRCGAAAVAVAGDSVPLEGPAGGGGYAVQVAALQSIAAADELMRALHAEGYTRVRVVQEEGYLKVRVGRFANRSEAARLVRELSRKFGGKPFVVEER